VELRDRKIEKENNKRLGLMDEFVEEIKESEKKSEDKQTEREEMKEKKKYMTKRLGPEKFQKPEVEVLLTEQLPEKLKNLKTDFDPLKDRFSSLQQRNIIEPRSLKRYHNRYKTKYIEKYHYKVFNREQEKEYADL